MKITGTTRLYGIIGDPIVQVRSPETYTGHFQRTGVDAVLVPIHVPVDRFETIVPALLAIGNLDGLLVTVPFKARMTRFAQRLGRTAEIIGAVNALRREADGSWTGDMFDGVGFVRGAQGKGERVAGRRVALFGAGGAGSAIACALADAGVSSIDVIDVDTRRAEALVYRLQAAFPSVRLSVESGVRKGTDMVVNASPVGMRPGDGLPGDVGRLDPDTLVGDVVIAATPTPLIRHAMQCNCRWVDGGEMHAGQTQALTSFFASASRSTSAAHDSAH